MGEFARMLRAAHGSRGVLMVALAFFGAASVRSDEPRVIAYFNSGNGAVLQNATDYAYTHYIVSFLLPNPEGNQLGFDAIATEMYGTTITTSVAQGIRDLQASGAKVMLAFGGATVSTAQYAALNGNISLLASQISSFVKNPVAQGGLPLHFDGVDIDWEDTAAFIDPSGSGYNGVEFLQDLTTALRQPGNLPSSEGWLMSHAPQPPYLSDEFNWSSGGYGGYIPVLNEVQDEIDWINMQYYNNSGFNDAEQAVDNYQSIVTGWSGVPGIPDFIGLPSQKLVAGKPIAPGDAGSGYMPVNQFVSGILDPLMDEYGGEFGGAFGWQLNSDINGVWGEAVAAALVVPEPSTFFLLAGGLGLAAFAKRRRKRNLNTSPDRGSVSGYSTDRGSRTCSLGRQT